MPPVSPNTAAYFTLINHGDANELISVSTPVAREAQLHTLVTENDVVKMRQVNGFPVEAHGMLMLGERGDHIMLLGLHAPLVEGEMVAFELTFKSGEIVKISLPVSKVSVAADDHHHHHH